MTKEIFMKKSFWIAFAIIFLCVVFIGTGVFLAEKNLKNSKKSLVDSSLKDELSIIKNNIKDGGITLPANQQQPASSPAENIPENNKMETPAPVKEETTKAPVEEPIKESTPETVANKYSFGILGDTQRTTFAASGGFSKAVKIIKEKNPEFLVAIGDLVSSCDETDKCQSKMNSWKGVIDSLFSKTYAIMGNHDRVGGDKADKIWQDFFNFPTNGPSGFSELAYSLDVKNAHLVFLNSDKPKENAINSEQQDWLKKDLQTNQKELIFVFFHEPAYPVSSKIDESLDANEENRDALWKILKDKKVTAVFSGHEHIASRKKNDGVYQFVFGNTEAFNHDLPKSGVAEYSHQGQTFGWVEVADKKVIVKTFSVDGQELNSFEIPL
jgi:predicted phosphodiesterase